MRTASAKASQTRLEPEALVGGKGTVGGDTSTTLKNKVVILSAAKNLQLLVFVTSE
jgi:hypothetical protein